MAHMSDAYFTIDDDLVGGDATLHTVFLRGELDGTVAVDVVRRFRQMAESTVVVDLRELTFIDGSGVNAFCRARHESEERGQTLIFRGAGESVRRVFTIMGLEAILDGG
jgi:anti-sigma B factor antagonist